MKERYLYLLQSRKTDSAKVAEMVGSCIGELASEYQGFSLRNEEKMMIQKNDSFADDRCVTKRAVMPPLAVL